MLRETRQEGNLEAIPHSRATEALWGFKSWQLIFLFKSGYQHNFYVTCKFYFQKQIRIRVLEYLGLIKLAAQYANVGASQVAQW